MLPRPTILTMKLLQRSYISTWHIYMYIYICIWWISTLTLWGRVTHICVGNLTIIGPDKGLSPGRRQAIIWTNAGILLIGTLGTNFSEILIEIIIFSFKKMCLKVSSAKRRPFFLGLNVLNCSEIYVPAFDYFCSDFRDGWATFPCEVDHYSLWSEISNFRLCDDLQLPELTLFTDK